MYPGQRRQSISKFNVQQGGNNCLLVTTYGQVIYEEEPIKMEDGQIAGEVARLLGHIPKPYHEKLRSTLLNVDVMAQKIDVLFPGRIPFSIRLIFWMSLPWTSDPDAFILYYKMLSRRNYLRC